VRAFGGHLRQALAIGLRSRWKAFLAGLGITALLQSSTATALISTSFIAAGFMGLVPALAVTLGANVGTTLIVQVLTFPVAAVAPVCVLAGLVAFNRGGKTRTRDLGRVGIGIGLILLALHLIIATIEPVEKARRDAQHKEAKDRARHPGTRKRRSRSYQRVMILMHGLTRPPADRSLHCRSLGLLGCQHIPALARRKPTGKQACLSRGSEPAGHRLGLLLALATPRNPFDLVERVARRHAYKRWTAGAPFHLLSMARCTLFRIERCCLVALCCGQRRDALLAGAATSAFAVWRACRDPSDGGDECDPQDQIAAPSA
jgi:hypothetical protein